MASVSYNSALYDMIRGQIAVGVDTIKVLLTTSAYVENFATHTKRSDVTNEVTGTGYTAGGNTATCTVAVDTASTPDSVLITLGGTSWATSTITARKAIYYKSRGGVATADELIACNDFGSDVISTAGTFTLAASTQRVSLTGQG